MTTIQQIICLIAIALVVLACRVVPLFLPKKLIQTNWMLYINKYLPICIMTILIFVNISKPNFADFISMKKYSFELIALGLVVVSYKFTRNYLISIGSGILLLNLLDFL